MKNTLFDIKTLNRKAEEEVKLDHNNLIERRKELDKWIKNLELGILDNSKEEELQGEFLKDIFSKVLNAINKTDGKEKWNLQRETKTKIDGQKADGVLGYFSNESEDIRAVIELKGPKENLDLKQSRKNDNRTPVEQAFSYAPKYGKSCKWIIVSNYKEIRLYRSSDMLEYHSFYLKYLKDDLEFKKFIYVLSFNALMGIDGRKSKIEELSEEYSKNQKEIQKKFYEDYKSIRISVFNNLKNNNKDISHEILLEKAQKLLDRFLFISFCEDKELLPKNIYHNIVEKGNMIKDTYQSFKNLCQWIDKGSKKNEINRYNGGLFKEDEILDDLMIDDKIFNELEKISNYDFSSDLNENILGHIFEQSISDIEDLKNENVDKNSGKRKKDGIFYTPKYITKYMVETVIKNWINDKKKELGEDKLPIITKNDNYKKTKNYKKNLEFWYNLKEELKKIKIIDPACGSGAFLIAAFEYLKKNFDYINERIADLDGAMDLFADVENDILKNNLYGVDINNESVEITKLSLWLKTANKDKQLISLDDNIKCGNSLIDDKNISPKAFNWKEEFKEVFDKGGFDIVIGNPPYGVNFNELEKEYLDKFDKLVPDYEIYIYFISLYKKILKKDSYLTYIFPNTFLSNLFSVKYKNRLFEDTEIIEIVNLTNDNTFEEAGVKTIIFSLKNVEKKEYETKFSNIENKKINVFYTYFKKDLLDNIENIFNLFYQNKSERKIIQKILNTTKLNDFFEVSQGYIPYRRSDLIKKFGFELGNKIVDDKLWHSQEKIDNNWKNEILGKDINRFYYKRTGGYVKYGNFVASYVNVKFFEKIRILIREITTERLYSCLIDEVAYNNPSLINVINEKRILDLKYLLVILNSKLIGWLHNKNSPKANKGLFPKILINDVRNIPIKEISLEKQKQFIEKADLMLELHRSFNDLKDKFIRNIQREFNLEKISKKLSEWYLLEYKDFLKELEKNKIKLSLNVKAEWEPYFLEEKEKILILKNEIEQTDKEIDKMVYKLYELTDEEIQIIENSI